MSASASYVCREFVEDVTAYLEGTLPDDVMRLVEEHLAGCPHCREYLAQMRTTISMTREVGEREVEHMPDDLRERLERAFRERPLE